MTYLWFELQYTGNMPYFHVTINGVVSLCKKRFNPPRWQVISLPRTPSQIYICTSCIRNGGLDKHDVAIPIPDTNPRYTTHVYVINVWDYYKVGIANDVSVRFRDLQCANPEQLTLTYCSPACTRQGARQVEQAIHREFQQWRSFAPHQREWFRLVNGADVLIGEIEMRVREVRGD